MAPTGSNLMIVDDLMRDVMEALAHGHATLVEKSESPIGTLAVKTADLTLDFDLSAEAKKVGDTFRLQVRPTPFFGFSTEVSSSSEELHIQSRNHAHVVLHIVNIAPLPSPADEPNEPQEPDDDRETDVERQEKVMEALAAVLWFMRNSSGLSITLGTKRLHTIDAAFEEALTKFEQGFEGNAQLGVRPFYGELREAILAQQDIREIKPYLNTLDEWFDWASAQNVAPPWQERLEKPLSNLRQLVGDLPVPPSVKGQFTRRVRQVLDSADESEAAARLVDAIADLKQRTQALSLPDDVRRTLDDIDFG